jgi:glycosyltransferase involved in cell wall biosynthesis
MIGWEFPPAKTGGLGTHCYELVKNLSKRGVGVTLLIPKRTENVKHDIPNVEIIEVGSIALNPYNTTKVDNKTFEKGYGWNFFEEVKAFNRKCVEVARNKKFDVIHCHDWMTSSAGLELRKITGKRMVFTVHSTEYDRTANIYPMNFIVDVEKKGIHGSDLIITVSEGMKKQLIDRYGADEKKITVIYNGIDSSKYFGLTKKGNNSTVLFLGRLTNQKGTWFFLHAAKKVLEKKKDVTFIVAGQGEQMPEMIKLAIDLNIMNRFIFTGYLPEDEILRAYATADVYVMPSVSEPFGITALEAIASGTPVIVSKNAGVAEKIIHCFKVDFWDTHEMANEIIGLLKYPVLKECMRKNCYKEINNFGWDRVADQTISVYSRVL